MGKKGVISYTRQPLEATKHVSTEKQLAMIREYCDSEGWNLITSFDDRGPSGSREERSAWKELIEFIERTPGIYALLVTNPDRLTRNMPEYAKLKNMLLQKDVLLYMISENGTRAMPLVTDDEWDFLLACAELTTSN